MNRWAVLAGAWAVYAAFALVTAATGAMVPEIRDGLGLSNTQMGLILGAWQFVYIGMSIPGGRLVDWAGARRAILLSAVLITASGFLRASATGFWSMVAAVGLLGVGAPIISIGAPAVAANLFDGDSRRLAVACYSTAPPIGSIAGLILSTTVLGPALGPAADGSFGGWGTEPWRLILIVQASLAAVAVMVWLVTSAGLDGRMSPRSGPPLSGYLALASLPVMRFVLVMAAVNFFVVHGVGQWLVDILATHGWSKTTAGTGAAWSAALGMVAGFVVPRLADERRRPAMMVVAALVGAAATMALASPTSTILIGSLTVSGAARVVMMPLLIMVMMDHHDVGPTRTAAASGLFFSVAQIGGVTGPAFTGAARDATGSFTMPLAVHATVLISVAAFVALTYRRATS